MASVRQPNGVPTQGVAFPDSTGAYWSTTYQTPFTSVYLYTIGPSGNTAPILLGGIQSFRPSENAQTRDGYQSGSDWIEFIMQPRLWTVSCTRIIPRGYDLRNVLRQTYGYVSDPDFRQLPVVLMMNYNQVDPSGSVVVENASWSWSLGTIQTYDGPYWSDPFDAFREDWTFKGRGISYSDSNKQSYANPSQLWGQAPATH